ncbi:hypothetical protein [Rhodococcus koreensis]|uniref:hypothetical protein n=1 Tax=Rhodococcus koreensis TaxID=99653 RepID=UPI0036DCB9CD
MPGMVAAARGDTRRVLNGVLRRLRVLRVVEWAGEIDCTPATGSWWGRFVPG